MRNITTSLITVLALSLVPVAGCATDPGDDLSDSDDEASAPGSVDMWQATDGQWHFHVVAGNGNILLASEAYTTRAGAINGILSVKSNGADPGQYQMEQAAHGFVLHLLATNGQTIGFTEVYSTKTSAQRAITSCVRAVTSYNTKMSLTAGARVTVIKGDSGQFHFNVFAKNGQIVLSSESYTDEANAWNGALSVQDNGVNSYAYEVQQAASGGFFFNLKAENGEIVGTSQVDTTAESAKTGRDALVTLLPTIDII